MCVVRAGFELYPLKGVHPACTQYLGLGLGPHDLHPAYAFRVTVTVRGPTVCTQHLGLGLGLVFIDHMHPHQPTQQCLLCVMQVNSFPLPHPKCCYKLGMRHSCKFASL